MIPRRQRLTRARFPAGRLPGRGVSPSLSISFGPAKAGGLSVVVGKAAVKRAAARHLLKRRLLSVLRPWYAADRSLIVYAKKEAATLPFSALKEELTSLLARSLR